MTITCKPSSSKMEFSGNIVADAQKFNTKNGEGVSFRIAHNQGKDKKAVYMDVVMYSSARRNIPHDILKKGKYVKVTGSYFESENTGQDGTVYNNHGIKAYDVAEIKSVVMELSEDGKTATAIDADGDTDTDDDIPA